MIERKVQASTVAAAATSLAMWALARYVFKGSVPDVVASWMYAIVPGLLTFIAGYYAPHTPGCLWSRLSRLLLRRTWACPAGALAEVIAAGR